MNGPVFLRIIVLLFINHTNPISAERCARLKIKQAEPPGKQQTRG